jgi:hypothetical protein
MLVYPPPGIEDRTDTPGATISGFMVMLSQSEGPRLEKLAMNSASFTAPTARALYGVLALLAGEFTVKSPGPSFPAEKT